MNDLREELLANQVEDKMKGAGQQLRLWSTHEEMRMILEAGMRSILGRSRIESLLTFSFVVDMPMTPPPKYEQLSLPLDI